MAAPGESRSELLHWLNSLLQLNVTKVEQCGTGAALCQVFDSIFLDLPMARVKFNVNTEYAYLQNFKILQNCFTRHAIERTIPVEALVKCKMQDNLEFLQWSKRYWDQYFPGHDYDAVARRKAAGGPAAATPTPTARTSTTAARKPASSSSSATTTASRGAGPRVGGAVGGAAAGGALAAMRTENERLKEAIADLEKERDFYFHKLREIETLVQTAIEHDPELDKDEDGLIRNIQAILYSTEEGFEIPTEADVDGNGLDEPETF